MKARIAGWLCLLLSMCMTAQAQNEYVAIMEPINQLFEGMTKGDSALVHQAFMNDVSMSSIGPDKSGQQQLRKSSLKNFLVAMGTPHQEVYSEPLWNVKIDYDGHMAQVWADYAFYLGNTFHHCGVDAFHLYKTATGWKIYELSDTRQTENCIIPQEIQDKFK